MKSSFCKSSQREIEKNSWEINWVAKSQFSSSESPTREDVRLTDSARACNRTCVMHCSARAPVYARAQGSWVSVDFDSFSSSFFTWNQPHLSLLEAPSMTARFPGTGCGSRRWETVRSYFSGRCGGEGPRACAFRTWKTGFCRWLETNNPQNDRSRGSVGVVLGFCRLIT